MEISEEVLSAMKSAKYIIALTGAGISAESGLITFRGKDGIWEKFDADEVATPEAFKRDAKKVWDFHEYFRTEIAKNKPNPAHTTLAEMESEFDKFSIITQNIDQYHQDAGSSKVIELHGNAWRVKCLAEGTVSVNMENPMKELPPKCSCGSMLRPDVVWFNEPLPRDELESAFQAAGSCDVMLVVGTSLVVQPAAMLPFIAYEHGAKIIEFNPEQTPITRFALQSFYGKAGDTLPEFWEAVKKH